MKKILLTLVAFAFVSVMATTNAQAASVSGTMNVQANVVASCTVDSTNANINFGAYDPSSGTPLDFAAGASDFDYSCTKGTFYNLYITGVRDMSGLAFGNPLNYELYSDAPGGTVFPAVAGVLTGTTITNALATQVLAGRITNGQDVSIDTYSSANLGSADPVITVEY